MKRIFVFCIFLFANLSYAQNQQISQGEQIVIGMDRINTIIEALKQDEKLNKIIVEADKKWVEKMQTLHQQKQAIEMLKKENEELKAKVAAIEKKEETKDDSK